MNKISKQNDTFLGGLVSFVSGTLSLFFYYVSINGNIHASIIFSLLSFLMFLVSLVNTRGAYALSFCMPIAFLMKILLIPYAFPTYNFIDFSPIVTFIFPILFLYRKPKLSKNKLIKINSLIFLFSALFMLVSLVMHNKALGPHFC